MRSLFVSAASLAMTWLRVVQINDVYELDNFPNLKTLIDKHNKSSKNETPDRFCVVCAGDFLAPSLLSSLDKGTAMVDVLNAVGCDYVCFGNHESDVPTDALEKRIHQSNFGWINSNMQSLKDIIEVDTPDRQILSIPSSSGSTRRVALLGLLTNDPSLYRPGAFGGATIRPVLETAREYVERIGKNVDLILPMTHQGIEDDRIMANAFGGKVFPIILGGHDHEPFDEVHNTSRVIKTGMDAEQAAIIDIVWKTSDPDERPNIHVELKATREYPPDPHVEERVHSHQVILRELEGASLFNIADWVGSPSVPTTNGASSANGASHSVFSTRNNRIGPSTGTSALCSMLRMGLRCQCAIINAGSVRGGRDYKVGEHFSWSDLKAEIPFATKMTACCIPGRVLEQAIRRSRQFAKQGAAQGCYLHTSRNLHYNDETERIESIMGEPFDPDKEYLTALPLSFFHGMDNHEPLLEWAKGATNTTFLDEEAARPAKLVLVELFSSLLWLRLGTFEAVSRGDGKITREDVRVRLAELYGNQGVADLMLDNVFSIADVDRNGTISTLEQMVVQFVATDMLEHVVTDNEIVVLQDVAMRVLGSDLSAEEVEEMVSSVRKTLDLMGTGTVQREEIIRALGEVRNRELLE